VVSHGLRRLLSAGNMHALSAKVVGTSTPNGSRQVPQNHALDLTGNVALTVLLMRDDYWRSRIVETVTIDRALAARTNRGYQVAPLIEAVKDILDGSEPAADHVHVVLPLGALPKRIMVGFDVIVQSGEAFLLKRREIARRQSAFISDLAQKDLGIEPKPKTLEFLTAICEFTPGPWQRFRRGWYRFRRDSKSLRQYLESGLGFPIEDNELRTWQESASSICKLMHTSLRERPDRESSSENILLALPILSAKGLLPSVSTVTQYVKELEYFISECAGKCDESTRILKTIAEYGKRFPVLISCKVPLREPASVSVAQDIPLKIGLRGRSEIDVIFNDAASNHIAIRVSDPDVQLKWRKLGGSNGEKLRVNLFNLVRESKEDLAIYGSEPDRPDRIRLRFRLTLPWVPKLIMMAFVLLTMASIYMVVYLGNVTDVAGQTRLASDDLAVFVVPTTLAAGLVLVQQRTSLGSRLQRGLRLLVVGAIVALWTVVLVAYMKGWVM